MDEALQDLSTVWWAEIFPGLAVFFTILAFNLVGDGLSDALNPRLRE
jgi:ABC-type dipeptide/oligopeptide/nickel transport system permease subunit